MHYRNQTSSGHVHKTVNKRIPRSHYAAMYAEERQAQQWQAKLTEWQKTRRDPTTPKEKPHPDHPSGANP